MLGVWDRGLRSGNWHRMDEFDGGCLRFRCVQGERAARIQVSSLDAGVQVRFVDSNVRSYTAAGDDAILDAAAQLAVGKPLMVLFSTLEGAVAWAAMYIQVMRGHEE